MWSFSQLPFFFQTCTNGIRDKVCYVWITLALFACCLVQMALDYQLYYIMTLYLNHAIQAPSKTSLWPVWDHQQLVLAVFSAGVHSTYRNSMLHPIRCFLLWSPHAPNHLFSALLTYCGLPGVVQHYIPVASPPQCPRQYSLSMPGPN